MSKSKENPHQLFARRLPPRCLVRPRETEPAMPPPHAFAAWVQRIFRDRTRGVA